MMDNEQPASVVQALSRVMAELPAIGKDERAPAAMGGFAFRGIEAMTRVLQPLMARHGVVIVPRAKLSSIVPAPGQKENWQDVILSVEWAIYGPDGSFVEASTVGIGRDNADKGAPKAETQAFKALLLQLFCVSDATDDADGHDYSGGYRDEDRPEPFGVGAFAAMTEKAKADPRLAALLKQYAVDNGKRLTEGSFVEDEQWAHQVLDAMDRHLAERQARADAMRAEVAAQADAIAEGTVIDAPPGAVEVPA